MRSPSRRGPVPSRGRALAIGKRGGSGRRAYRLVLRLGFGLLFAVLLLRPKGLFGTTNERKV